MGAAGRGAPQRGAVALTRGYKTASGLICRGSNWILLLSRASEPALFLFKYCSEHYFEDTLSHPYYLNCDVADRLDKQVVNQLCIHYRGCPKGIYWMQKNIQVWLDF
jgi:hypothetical protein